jgi:flagellin
MGLRISTNVASINSQRNMSGTQRQMSKSLGQLSSGNRINISADDAAGLAISERLKSNIRSTRQANRNANDGISMVQTAEGGLNEIGNVITRLRELAIQASSDTIGEVERGFLNKEVQQLKSEIQRISASTTWNSTKLLDGSTPQFEFQIGIYEDAEVNRINFDASTTNAQLDTLGLSDVDFSTKEGARNSLAFLDAAQTNVNGMRADIGALQNRLVSTSENLGVLEENMSAANSRIRDTDIAAASSELTRNNILLQAGTATLAQANQMSQLALKLIG